jgi:hypothetical protein
MRTDPTYGLPRKDLRRPRRAMRIIMASGAGFVILILSLLLWSGITSRMTSEKIDARDSYWRSVVNAAVSVGEPRVEAENWLARKISHRYRVTDFYNLNDNSLALPVETIRVTGPPFPCSAWEIEVRIQFGRDNRVRSRTISNSGLCL